MLFQRASLLNPDIGKYSNWNDIASLKIEGNSFFNEGLEHQLQGDALMSASKYTEAKEKYEQAKQKFEEGLTKSGDKRFQGSIDFVSEQIRHVEEEKEKVQMLKEIKIPTKKTGAVAVVEDDIIEDKDDTVTTTDKGP
jgi:hypothetical protein